MGDVESLYQQAKKQALLINEGLQRLEEAEAGARGGDTAALGRDLRVKLKDLQTIAQELQTAWRMQNIGNSQTKRAVWSLKVEQVQDDVQAIRRALEKYGTREQRRQADQAYREELFAGADAGRRAKQDMDAESQIQESMAQSNRGIAQILEAGQNILGNMASNREIIKRAQTKALDVLNSINMGSTILKLINRRQRMDIWITYGGMALTLLFVIFLMWFMWG